MTDDPVEESTSTSRLVEDELARDLPHHLGGVSGRDPTPRASSSASREKLSEARTAERKRELVEVAGRLFAERGFRGTSMADIARQFGVQKATLYHWVDSKESLLAEVLATAAKQHADEIRTEVDLDLPAAERLRRMAHIHIRSWADRLHNMQVGLFDAQWLGEDDLAEWNKSRAAIFNAYRQVLLDGYEGGEFVFDPNDLTLIAHSIQGMFQWFPRWYRKDAWASPEYIANLMCNIILSGLLVRSSRTNSERHE